MDSRTSGDRAHQQDSLARRLTIADENHDACFVVEPNVPPEAGKPVLVLRDTEQGPLFAVVVEPGPSDRVIGKLVGTYHQL